MSPRPRFILLSLSLSLAPTPRRCHHCASCPSVSLHCRWSPRGRNALLTRRYITASARHSSLWTLRFVDGKDSSSTAAAASLCESLHRESRDSPLDVSNVRGARPRIVGFEAVSPHLRLSLARSLALSLSRPPSVPVSAEQQSSHVPLSLHCVYLAMSSPHSFP
ncbi:hypothetical protein LZ31DRAFT_149989 [Colletotrichum somersetense]|nr:hypothetical protein LZ31DRAFT_149989 [Colletotrichum somersetense]